MERRSFLKWATHGLGALFGAVLGVPAVAYLIDPAKRQGRAVDFRAVAKLSELKRDIPHQVVIRDVRSDAWTLNPNDVIGRVWLVRRDGDTLDAFTTTCPHLGCSVNFVDAEQRFVCPCHGGTFHLSGKRLSDQELGSANPVPRDMDTLEWRFADPEKPEVIEVRYQSFHQGHADKVSKV